ncbi:hypothetical protein AB0758_00070 [Tolypothrix bouteillei VB521301_2]|uniref:hypothetical protein n=1 Tax=Tolypothrix bouteillei TaxID=1246981 RepID=UPI0038B66151
MAYPNPGSGIGLVVTGREGRVVDSRSFALLRVTKSTETASVLRGSPGLGGKPPRPVTGKTASYISTRSTALCYLGVNWYCWC